MSIPVVDLTSAVPGEQKLTAAVKLQQSSGRAVWSDPIELDQAADGWHAVRPGGSIAPSKKMPASEFEALVRASVLTGSASSGGGKVQPDTATTNLCFKQVVIMTGEGIGEDRLTLDTTYPFRGMFVYIPNLYFGFLDAAGRTGNITLTSGTYPVTAYAASIVNGVPSYVDTNGDGYISTYAFNINVTEGGTRTFSWWPFTVQEQFNIALFAAEGFYYDPGHVTDTYVFHALAPGSYNKGGEIYIKTGKGYYKFLVGHEQGHAFFARNTSVNWLADYSWVGAPSPCDSGGSTGHDIDSVEYSSVTFNEAAASFYAALTYNNIEHNCYFYHARYGAVDCEAGQVTLPLRFMEQTCDLPWAGRGVEVDWLRQLWDVRTYYSAFAPRMDDILAWIDAVPNAFNDTNAYQNLDAAANAVGGTLDSSWDANKGLNGVDW